MLKQLRARQELQFFGVLHKADLWLAIAWWSVLLLRGILPAVFAIAVGVLVGAGCGTRAGRLVARSPLWPPSSWRCRF